MKIVRLKKAQKILTYYCTNFGYRDPFQFLVDGTFCHAALQSKVAIEEQLQKYLQHNIKLVTTQCIILEVEDLGLTGAALIVKQFIVHKCGHEGKPVSGSNCIKSMIKGSRYIVATQDRSLQNHLRRIPGQALLYLHKSAPVLEAPSDSTKKSIQNKTNSMFNTIEANVKKLKNEEGIQSDNNKIKSGGKRNHPKNPNPLSCKKKKKQKLEEKATNQVNTNKTKRKRIKIPSHIREHVKNVGKNVQ